METATKQVANTDTGGSHEIQCNVALDNEKEFLKFLRKVAEAAGDLAKENDQKRAKEKTDEELELETSNCMDDSDEEVGEENDHVGDPFGGISGIGRSGAGSGENGEDGTVQQNEGGGAGGGADGSAKDGGGGGVAT